MYDEYARAEIRIDRLEIYANHGVYPEETQNGQIFQINAVLYTDTRAAGRRDELELSTDYGEVSLFIERWMKENTCKLLETVAEKLTEAILLKYDLISAIDLEICKPEAPIPLEFRNVSVKVHRGWHRAYLAIGSNMGDKEAYINGAIAALKAHPLIRLKKVSDIIETEPYGGVVQDSFLNGALEVETLLAPEELLEALHEIENAADRVRIQRWGPRTLDLDILFYDKLVYESETLVIPHSDMQNRDFVLRPMCMIAPYFRHPLYGETMQQMLQKLEASPEK